MTRLLALALLAVLASGCTGDEQPADVARTGSTSSSSPTTSPTGATGATGTPEPAAEPLVLNGGTGASVRIDCDDDSSAYLSLYRSADVDNELRLGEVTVAGGGRLVGQVFIAPTRKRTADRGALVLDDRPGFGAVDDLPEWADRVPLQGVLVQPGTYLVFAQVELSPRSALEGLDFSFFDSNTTGSARLDVSGSVVQTCRD